ncbi:MAG TPA: metal-dependent hydrolase [Longimicrobiales bacterium]
MPLPLAHSIVGYSFAAATGIRFRRETVTAILFSVVVANLPDTDFLPGFLANQPVMYHRTVAHTLPAALVCGLIIGVVLTRFGKRFWEITLLGTVVFASHLFADMLNLTGTNFGVQILWPITDNWYSIDTPLARYGDWFNFHRGEDSAGFFASFFSWSFLRALLMQSLIFTPLLIPALWLRHFRSRQATAE